MERVQESRRSFYQYADGPLEITDPSSPDGKVARKPVHQDLRNELLGMYKTYEEVIKEPTKPATVTPPDLEALQGALRAIEMFRRSLDSLLRVRGAES